jgi:hypothetical protein
MLAHFAYRRHVELAPRWLRRRDLDIVPRPQQWLNWTAPPFEMLVTRRIELRHQALVPIVGDAVSIGLRRYSLTA